jgi:hypothetical protein
MRRNFASACEKFPECYRCRQIHACLSETPPINSEVVMRLAIFSLALSALLPALPAAAQDLSVYAGLGLTVDNAEDDTNTDLNLYVEGDFRGIYFGLSGDVVSVTDGNYVDVYLGYRNELDSGFSYDLSYDETLYPSDSASNYSTVALSLGMPLGDVAAVYFDASYYPDDESSDGYVTADYYLGDKITLTASIGLINYAEGGGPTVMDYELAASYQISEKTSATLHYYDGDDYDGYIALDLNWDTTLLGE